MNSRTQREITKLIDSIELLTMSVLIHIGQETATQVLNQCEQTKLALAHDETIVEVA